MFREFLKKKVKETDVLNPRFKVPEQYYPEWYNKGLVPIEIEDERLRGIMDNSSQSKRFPAAIIDDDDDMPKIKPAKEMQKEEETMWYDEISKEMPQDKIIDNNDFVDNEKLQKHKVNMPDNNDDISSIRAKILEKQKPKKEQLTVAAPGEFVVMVRGKPVHIGNLESTKSMCEEIIVKDEELTADDFMIFLRLPLSKIFK